MRREARVLVTGASGFVGSRVVQNLLERGFRNVRCLVRRSSDLGRLRGVLDEHGKCGIELVNGNLLSPEDCRRAVRDVEVVYHLAAGTGTKSFADAFLNSVVTTRNLLEAVRLEGRLRRFVNLSSFAVYTNVGNPNGGILDECSPTEGRPESRAEAYCYAKVKQDELVVEYGGNYGIPFVLVRPGVVYGPGKRAISGRVGIDTFGIFLHLGGSNKIPLTYVDNCADAIVLAGLVPALDGQAINVVDDELPSSREFLRAYKSEVKEFRSVGVPHWLSYLLCGVWERYAKWSDGQLPPVFTRREWAAYWKRTVYSNAKAKQLLGWSPKTSTREGLRLSFESWREGR